MIVIIRHNLITGPNFANDIEVHPGDLSGRDNVALAMAGSNLTSAFQTLYDLGGVSLEEMVRVLYRFIGEEGDPKEIVSQGTGVDKRQVSTGNPNLKQPVKVNPEPGKSKDSNFADKVT